MAWPRLLRWLPHVLVVLAACSLAATGLQAPVRPLTVAHAAVLAAGLLWPVPAWWVSTAFVTAISIFHPPTDDNELWVWVVQAGAIFLVALRNRLRVAVGAALISGLLALGLKLVGTDLGGWEVVRSAAATFAMATFLGGAVHSRRRARERLAEQEAVAARERAHRTLLEERARIARELHDVVAHHMSLIAIQADAAPYRVADPPSELVVAFGSIRGNALEALTELRHVLGVLRSQAPDDVMAAHAPQPTLEQLDDLLANVRATGMQVEASVHRTSRSLPPSVELSTFRIVQEALSNVVRHAPGCRVRVEIVHDAVGVRLRVLNGPRTHAAERTSVGAAGSGHGLLGMRERAAMLGGELSAGPTPDGGYEVTALLPVPATTHEDSHP